MGEIAEMMLEGTLCEGCGVFMGDAGPGHPRRCWDCRKDQTGIHPLLRKVNCPRCQRRVKEVGLADHMRDKHGEALVKTQEKSP
jgi:Zn finger protein HypA/HybF involved in hydrogenase expression